MRLPDAEVERRIVAALDATAQAVAAADRAAQADVVVSVPHELVVARPVPGRRSRTQTATLATLAACVVSGLIATVLIVVAQSGGRSNAPQPGGTTPRVSSPTPTTSLSPTGSSPSQSSSTSCEPGSSKSVPSGSFTPNNASSSNVSASAFYFSSSAANPASTSPSGCAGG
jgi:hypothetical protein